MNPTVAIVTPSKATYYKPLYEAFANEMPDLWRTLILWPAGHESEHPQSLLIPHSPKLDIARVKSGKAGYNDKKNRFLPSKEAFSSLRNADVRLVWIHEYSPFSLQGLLYAKINKIPLVMSTEVGMKNVHYFSWKTRLWHSIWGKFSDGFIACSPAAHEALSGPGRPTISAYHAVDSRVYSPSVRCTSSTETVTFTYVGQIIPRKGLDLWMKAAAKLKELGYSNFKLRCIGTGQMEWLHECIQANNLHEEVELAGFLSGDELRASINNSDAFVLPTRQDTYAAVVHEAACMGLPLLISKHAGAAEGLVREGINGYVCDPDNTPEFAEMMKKLMDADVRQRMSKEARISGEELSAHRRGAALWHWMAEQFSLSKEASTSLVSTSAAS